MGENNYINLIQKLDEFIRKYYKNQLIRGLIYTVGLLLLFYLGISTIEYFAEFNPTIRAFLFYSFVATCGFVLTKYIVIPVLKLNKLGKVISHEEAANIVGKHFSNVQDKLLNVIHLQQNKTDFASATLLQAGINQKIAELKPVPFTSAIDISENRKYLKYAIIPVFVLVSILIVKPRMLSTSTDRLIHYNTYYESAAPFKFEIVNKSLQGVQQQDFTLNVKLSGNEIPNEIFVLINGNEFRLDKDNITNFNYTFKNIQQNTKFQLSGGGFQSTMYELVVIPKPSLLNFEVQLKYPSYLNRKDEVVSNAGDLIIPQGTKVMWNFATKNTDYLNIRFVDTLLKLNQSAEDKFSYSRRFLQSSSYSINTGNAQIKAFDSVYYNINVVADAYPTIEVKEEKDSTQPNLIYFNGVAKDDYGFSRLSFKYKHIHTDTLGKMSETDKETVLGITKNQNAQSFVHYIDIKKLELSPGDKIEYYFEVLDNDGVNGAKSARSNVMVFKAPSIEELEKQTDENNKELKADLEKAMKEAKQLQKESNDLHKKLMEKKEMGWEEKKKLEELNKNQKALEKKIEQLKQDNQQNIEKQQEYQQPNENILEKQKELEKLFENIMSPEMKKLYDELQRLMEKMDKNKVQETLEKMKMTDKDIEKELDRTLEQFKQMEVEQKMEEAASKLDELAKKQEELSKQAEENKNADNKDLQKQQEDLNKQFDEVKKDLEEMKKLNQELSAPVQMPDMQQESEKVQQDQQKAKEELEKNNKKNASKSQKNAAKQMQDMADRMKEASEKNEEDQNEEDMQALRQIMENLMNVSFAQEDLIKKSQVTKTNDPQYTKLGQTQKKLQDDAQLIEDSLLALAKRNPKISAITNREISNIEMNMGKALDALEERQTTESMYRQQNAMTSINNLALLLNESLDQMQQEAKQQKNSKPGNGNCKKPGGKGSKTSASQQMGNMRKMQEALNKQIEELKKAMEKGGQKPGEKPGQKPGQSGMPGSSGMPMPGNSEQLAKLAAQQEAIRREMQKAMQQMQKDGGNNPGGDLQKLMEETETDLVNKRITQETMMRQQQILTKLLESEKAEREREFDEKRKSNEAKTQEYSENKQFLEYKKLKEKELELYKTIPPALNPYYKAKVSEYFNSFGK